MASDKIEYSRLLIKRSNVSGEIPTVPPVSAVTLNQFTPTDIFVGEFFANVEDETLYFRTNTGIVEIAVSGSTGTTIPSLVQVLNQGNTTGGFGVEVSSGNTITFNGLSSGVTATYLGLDASGNTITTVGGAGGQDLETTLGFGNTTGANDIIFTQGYRVEGALGKGYLEPEGADESISINYITTGVTGSLNIGDTQLNISYSDGSQSSNIQSDGNIIEIGNSGGLIQFVNTGATSGITIDATIGYPLYINNLTTGTSVNSLAIDANNRVILASPSSGGTSTITVGTTPISGGTVGRVAFEGTGNVFQQDSQLYWDNDNKGLGVGATPAATVKLDVRADSALSTDLSFRVRDSGDTFNIIAARNNGDVYVGLGAGYQSTGSANTFFGSYAGYVNTTGVNNAFFGYGAGRDNTGNSNTFIGQLAGYATTSGIENSFVGEQSGYNNLTGSQNTHIGQAAGFGIISGDYNITMGYYAGQYIGSGATSANTTSNQSIFIGSLSNALATGQTNQIVIGHQARGLGSNSVVIGNSSITKTSLNGDVGINNTSPTAQLDIKADSSSSSDLSFRIRNSGNTYNIIEARNDGDVYVGANAGYQSTGAGNSFFGQSAGYSNTTGVFNSFFGSGVGFRSTGRDNAFFGYESGRENTSGSENTFFGSESGYNNIIGDGNTHIGQSAAYTMASGSYNTTLGYFAGNYIGTGITSGNTSSSNSVFLGALTNSLATGQTNQIVIGYQASGLGSNSSIIGNSSTTLFKLFGSGLFENVAVAPAASVTDSFHFYGADIVAGNSAPHFRTEAGDTIKLYKNAAVTTPQGIATALTNLGLLTTSTLTGRTQQNLSTDNNQTIDASLYNAATWVGGNQVTSRNFNVTNLAIGDTFTLFIQCTFASGKTFVLQSNGASFSITSGIGALQSNTIALTVNQAFTVVYENINGTIVGRI